jgi:protein TonB
MRNNLTGLFLSGLLHAGLIGWAANASYEPIKEPPKIQTRVLNISLFEAEKIIPPAPAPIKVIKKEPAKPRVEPPASPKIVKKELPRPAIKIEPTPPPVKLKPDPIPEPSKPVVVAAIKPAPVMREVIKPKPVAVKKHTPKKKAKSKKKFIPKKVKKHRVNKYKKPQRKVTKKRSVTKPVIAKAKRKPQRRVIKKPVVAKRTVAHKKPAVRKYVKKGGVSHPRRTARAQQNHPRKQIQNYARKTNRKSPVAIRHAPARPATPYHKPVIRPSAANTTLIANLNKQYKARLRQLIVTAKRYPKRARRRNQQGKVRLAFTVSHSGTISQVRIIKSSGVSTLDTASIKAIQQISQKLPFLRGMPKKSLNLTMTLSYSIRNL